MVPCTLFRSASVKLVVKLSLYSYVYSHCCFLLCELLVQILCSPCSKGLFIFFLLIRMSLLYIKEFSLCYVCNASNFYFMVAWYLCFSFVTMRKAFMEPNVSVFSFVMSNMLEFTAYLESIFIIWKAL